MNRKLIWILSVAILICVSCSKEKKAEPKEGAKAETQAVSSTAVNEEIPFQSMIETAGFTVTNYVRFPSQEQKHKAWTILYRGSGGEKSGGILYVQKTPDGTSHHWHWYFTDDIPESVTPVEINEDGLWDMRVVMAGGEIRELIQEDSFTLIAPGRNDWIALNAHASPGIDDEYRFWKCFDGDTTSAWRVAIDSPEKPFVEIQAPFGIKDGILGIRTLDEEHPKEVEVYVDGKRIERVKLEQTAGYQMVHISPDIQGATRVRLLFKSAHDKSDVIAVAELSLM